MNLHRIIMLVAVWLLSITLPALAQVKRVVVETDGLSVACTPGLEAALKSLDSVYQYAISVQKQMFAVTYYQGEKFQPKDLHWAADKGESDVVRFHVSAEGKVRQEGDKQILVAGENQFEIVSPEKVPVDVPVGIMGTVLDDTVDPMTLKPDDVKTLTD